MKRRLLGDKLSEDRRTRKADTKWASNLALATKREQRELGGSTVPLVTKKRAAYDLASGMPQTEVAEKYNISVQSIRRWMRIPAFLKLVSQRSAEILAAQSRVGIAQKHVRLAENQADYDNLLRVQEERAERAEAILEVAAASGEIESDGGAALIAGVEPGDRTGLITRRIKGKGMVELALDREIIELKRLLREEAAIEIGDRDKDKGAGNTITVVVEYVDEGKKVGPGITIEDRSEAITLTPSATEGS